MQNWLNRRESDFGLPAGHLSGSGVDLDGLLRFVACSEIAAQTLNRDWDWFSNAMEDGSVAEAPARSDMQVEFDGLLRDRPGKDAFAAGLRRQRNRFLTHILWCDLVVGLGVEPILRALSDLADVAIIAALEFSRRLLAERFGTVRNDGEPVPLVVIAMGKLGGHELNVSSDVDLVFMYPSDGDSDGSRSITAHEYFTRLVRQVVALLEEPTADGFVYRVDTRLRPFGDSGPLVVSFAALESYLLKHGRSWERYAYVKARVVTPDESDAPCRELMRNIVRPFVYRRYLDYSVFESLRDMRALVTAEVQKREMQDNIKLGPGGIREVEFVVQALQLLRGGSIPALQTTELRVALQAAAAGHDMSAKDAAQLTDGYDFLRRIENRLQACRDQQTHDLPTDNVERERLAFAMGFAGWPELAAELERIRGVVSDQFSTVAFRDSEEPVNPSEFAELWSARAEHPRWQRAFENRGYSEPEALARAIAAFAALPSSKRTDAVAAKRLRKFIPNLLRLLQEKPRPARILRRVLNIADQVLRRSAYIALLNENKTVLDRLIELCDSSRYLAREVAQFPALLDELIDARIYESVPDAASLKADLDQRITAVDAGDIEQQIEVLAEFKRATLFRLAVADFNGSIPIMKVSDRLTDVAELILGRALEIAREDLLSRHGAPRYAIDGEERTADLGVIAYGKLGGLELSYGSDLDIVFVHDSCGDNQETAGPKSVDNSVFFGRLARRLVHFLTTRTPAGALYDIDTRLRPSGESGLLVTSIDAFERYQEQHAWTWEHQALLRGRAVAGSAIVAREFERIRSHTLRKRVRRLALRDDVAAMRTKMRASLDRSNERVFDLKQAPGAIADIEFLVQFLVLQNAEDYPAVIHFTDNIRQLDALAEAGCLAAEESHRLQQIYRRLRARTHRLALDEKPAFDAVDAFVDERRFVQQLWRRELGDAGSLRAKIVPPGPEARYRRTKR